MYLRFKDQEDCAKWLSALMDPLASPVFVDSDIEEDSKAAMLRSMAILRGETDKIDLSLTKYTTDLVSDPTVVGLLGPSMAVPTNVAAQAAAAQKKYDAFKHRSFIYDEEEEGAENTVLSPGLLAMGYTPAVKKRSNTIDSDGVDFQPTYPMASVEQEGDQDQDQEEQEEGEYAAEEEGEGSEGSDGEGDGDEGSSSGASADEHDPEGEQLDVAEGEGEESTPDGGEQTTTTSEGGTEPKPLYKLAGGSKHREPRDAHHHHAKAMPHSSSGNALEAPPSYKVGSHSRYQKGGDSWIKKDSPGGAALGAVKTPAKGHQPKQIIPTSDAKQPLARRHSNMINQCKCV